MAQSTLDIAQSARKPRAQQPGVPIVVRIQPEQLAVLDRWIEAQPDPKPSRPEAIRCLLTAALDPEA
jgi:hypothetical protein